MANIIERLLGLLPEQPLPPSAGRPLVNVVVAPLDTNPAKFSEYIGVIPNPDQVVEQQRLKAGIGFRTDYGPLYEMPAKDGYIAGLIQQRKAAVLKRPMFLKNADTSPDAQLCSAFMGKVIRGLNTEIDSAQFGGLYGDMNQMLDAPLVGLYVGKLVWGERRFAPMLRNQDRGRTRTWRVPVNIKQEDLSRVGFDDDGRLLIYARFKSDADRIKQGFRPSKTVDWWYPHPLSYVVWSPYSTADNPYGTALLSTVLICAWLFRRVRVMHANFIERNSNPLAVVEQDLNSHATDTDLDEIEDDLNNIYQGTGFTLPPGLSFRWHELMSQAGPQAIENFIRNCHYEASAAILGQSSTSMTERAGSQSSAEVQERVADSIVSMDSVMLQGVMNQIVRMTMAVNMPDKQDKWPEWVVQIKSADDREKRKEEFKTLVELGVKVPVSQVQREFAIDEPLPGEDVLEIQQAAFGTGAGAAGPTAPSQRTANKTAQKRTERSRNAPSRTEAQPRRR